MFEYTSRYYTLDTATFTRSDGRALVFVRRRFLPAASTSVLLAEHTVKQGERLDNITARYLSDPEQFWRLCDGNTAMQPEELTAEIGRKLRVPYPQP